MATLIEELAERHLGGQLPPDFIETMRPIDAQGDEMHAFVRRAFR